MNESTNETPDFFLPNGALNASLVIIHAETLLKAGDVVLARGLFRKALDTGKLSYLSLFGLARCAEAEGQLKTAQACYEASLLARPRVETFLRLSVVLQQLKQFVEAVQRLREAHALNGLSHVQRLEIKNKRIEALRMALSDMDLSLDLRSQFETELISLRT